jgi:signal transduction histidine kinase
MSENIPTTKVGNPDFTVADLRSGEALSELIHKIGHDIGNPLTAIISVCTLMQTIMEADGKKAAEYCNMLVGEAWKISGINERLVGLISVRSPYLVSCDVENNFINVLNRLQSRNKNKFEKLELIINKTISNQQVLADNQQLNLLATELLTNCADAFAKDCKLNNNSESKVYLDIFEDGNFICVAVNSTTHFSCELDLKELFKPFVTVGFPEEKKLGLGLTTVLAVVERLNGNVEIQEITNNEERKFKVIVKLPKAMEH